MRYTKKSRLQSRRRLLFLSVCVGFCPRLLSLSLSFLGDDKKDSPSFCKGAVERETLDALKSTHAQVILILY